MGLVKVNVGNRKRNPVSENNLVKKTKTSAGKKYVKLQNRFPQCHVQCAKPPFYCIYFTKFSSNISSFGANVLKLMQLFERQRSKFYWITVGINQYKKKSECVMLFYWHEYEMNMISVQINSLKVFV